MQNIMGDFKKKVVIIDYNLGNLFSVKQACDTVGMNAIISSDKKEIEEADALILPGVGAFIEAMTNLENLKLVEPIKNAVGNGKPLFGICLGLQLLFTKSEEFGSGEGLNLIDGVIRKFPAIYNERKIKVPQIAWNKIYSSKQHWGNSPLSEIEENEFMYFVHSYYVDPTEESCVMTLSNYEGLEYCSGISKNNIFATQFHPEKSAEKGISIYRNWAIINNLL
ncbi:imidazole glycerol phosphate synthase subunit HisH [Pedobacter frigoris]|uniref:Imidazole glycerol phosphate synthase subunit HisH n=1 Tax=Pedobacter frigoris TaxID=2571272 RepID=A0A4U1CFR7_9SPHI|nr:imidazole glycerol phosphate synthase subunit HisH [Pedobacter frigoris]TKC05263.1 imidazole glycerol phosphate synthase subunit HisH [Pedobacter frigoris]